MATTVNIAGRECKLPTIDSLTMDEAEILWEYGQVTIGDLVLNEGAAILRPAVLRAFLHIALVRADSSVKQEEITAAVGTVMLSDILQSLGEDDDADGPPTVAADSPPPPSENTGGSGNLTSDDKGSAPPSTGAPDSEKSAASARLTSVG